MVVEKLLQLLVGVVDAQLLEAVIIKDFKTGNIKNTNEPAVLPGYCALVELVIDPGYEATETSLVDSLGQGI